MTNEVKQCNQIGEGDNYLSNCTIYQTNQTCEYCAHKDRVNELQLEMKLTKYRLERLQQLLKELLKISREIGCYEEVLKNIDLGIFIDHGNDNIQSGSPTKCEHSGFAQPPYQDLPQPE